jgi:hypothetical protein
MDLSAQRQYLEKLVKVADGPSQIRKLIEQGKVDKELAESIIADSLLDDLQSMLDGENTKDDSPD